MGTEPTKTKLQEVWAAVRRDPGLTASEIGARNGIESRAARKILKCLTEGGYAERIKSGGCSYIFSVVPGREPPSDGRGKSPGSVASRRPWNGDRAAPARKLRAAALAAREAKTAAQQESVSAINDLHECWPSYARKILLYW